MSTGDHMPARWPGNSATKLARAATGGGFESDITSGGPIELPAANLYRQTFESKTPDPGELNTVNFNFYSLFNNLVTDLDGGTTGGSVYKDSTGIIDPPDQVPGVDWRAKEGSISLRVSCGTQTGTGTWEQNAESDVISGRDVWHRYWTRIPTNHAPTTNHINSQHKLFVIFQDDYSQNGDGSTCWMDIYHDSATGYMTSGLIDTVGGFTVSGGVSPKEPLFHATNDRGRWMQFVFLHRLESAPGAADGEQKFWARFEGDSAFKLQNSRTGRSLKRSTTAGLEGWRRYRFLSAREGDAAERQDWLFDIIEVADTPLVPAGTEGL